MTSSAVPCACKSTAGLGPTRKYSVIASTCSWAGWTRSRPTSGLHFYHFATHPEDQRELRKDPSKLEIGLSELLRAYSAVTTLRICAKEINIHGVTIKPGDRVAMPTPLGSNDPEAFEAPTEVRLDRRPAHLTFGYGPHRCLGSHLARRELQIAITEMFRVIPEFKLKLEFRCAFFLEQHHSRRRTSPGVVTAAQSLTAQRASAG